MPPRKNALNDGLELTINIKWLVQLIFFVVSIVGGWYSINGRITKAETELKNTHDAVMVQIVQIEEALVKFEEILDSRIKKLEGYKEQELEAVNRSLLSKVLGTNKDD